MDISPLWPLPVDHRPEVPVVPEVRPVDLVLLGVDLEVAHHPQGHLVAGGPGEQVEEHPLDGERRVVLGVGEAVSEGDELADLAEGAAAVRGDYVVNSLKILKSCMEGQSVFCVLQQISTF